MWRRISLLCLLTCFQLVSSCAQDVGDIDRTQPNLLDKAMFEGHAWYVRQTVIDVPPTSNFSFVGETGELEVIHWEIQQDYLVGYRAYEKVPGSESNADHTAAKVGSQPVAEGQGEGRNPDVFKGNPIVAYPILDHVDVIREYNPRTGEQTNIIQENTEDRPWYERRYIRVDWAQNKIGNFMFISNVAYVQPTNGGYVEENEGGADAFVRHTDADGIVDYFDFTERLHVQPEEDGCILSQRLELGDCTAAEVKVRTSFMRLDEARESDYEPLAYDDARQGEFGYFRTERPTYDRRRGVTWSGVQQLVNRHDLWFGSRDDDGESVDYRERGLRPVTYALSPDYPKDMREVTDEIAKEWDSTLKQTVARLRGQSVEDLTTDLSVETGKTCMFCLDENTDGHARIGDLRHNFIYWVDTPQLQGPLGYGPSSANPETGRIVAGMAYVYGASVDMQAEYAKDVVELLNGDRTEDDFLGAEFIRASINERRPSITDAVLGRSRQIPVAGARNHLLTPKQLERLADLRENGFPKANPGYAQRRLAQLDNTPLASMLIHDELILGQGHGRYKPGDVLPDDFLQSLAPSQWGTEEAIRNADARQKRAAQNNLWLADFNDPAVVGLAKAVKDEGLEGDALWQHLRERVYYGVMLHEIGHTLGLRHNFSGSADALNYHDEYWPLRIRTIKDEPETTADLLEMACEAETDDNRDACNAQLDGRMAEYQYSSIMDYGAQFNSDIHGLGRYDHAAIAAGYGDLVEVFDDEVVEQMSPINKDFFRAFGEFRSPIFGSLTETTHYSRLPTILGGTDAIAKRHYVTRDTYEKWLENDPDTAPLRVPYMACYDEYVDATASCHRWDQGADPFEIANQWITAYREYYPLLNFQRDRVGFSSFDVRTRVTSRYFLPLNNMYQHWLFQRLPGAIDGDPGPAILDAYSTIGMRRGFSLLWEVMATPRYGSYLRSESGSYSWETYDKVDGAALYVPPGRGRREFSRYDIDSGYNLFQRLLESGYFYEQIGALTALTASNAEVLSIGADLNADQLAYSLPYYLLFQEQIDALFTGVITQDANTYGPRISNDGRILHRDFSLDSTGAVDEAAGELLPVRTSWTTRLFTMVYGMSLLTSNLDLSFVRKGQVVIQGEGEPVAIAPGFSEVSYTDPQSGRTYTAYYDAARGIDSFVGAKLVVQLQELTDRLLITPAGSAESAFLQNGIVERIQNLDMMRALFSEFEFAL